MENKLKLAEIKGYVEGCLNKFDETPTSGPINYFFKDLNAILDIIVDKQSQSDKEEINELKHFNEHWKEVAEKFSNKNQKLYQDMKKLELDNRLLTRENETLKKELARLEMVEIDLGNKNHRLQMDNLRLKGALKND